MELVTGALIATTLLGGTAAVVVTMPSEKGCAITHEMRKDGPTKVTVCGDVEQAEPLFFKDNPAKGTGGLVLRDVNGRDTGSGIGQKQTFQFMSCGPKGSGLIYVMQLDRRGGWGVGGGWGDLYGGYVKKAYTAHPGAYPCK